MADTVAGFSASLAGLVAYRSGGSTNRRQLTWFDRSGKAVDTLGGPDENSLQNLNLSPDGRRVVADRAIEGNRDIWLLDGTRATRFTTDESDDDFPIWSADGSRPRPGALQFFSALYVCLRPHIHIDTQSAIIQGPWCFML